MNSGGVTGEKRRVTEKMWWIEKGCLTTAKNIIRIIFVNVKIVIIQRNYTLTSETSCMYLTCKKNTGFFPFLGFGDTIGNISL